MSSTIVVIGSLNMDLIVLTERVPQAGETLAGKEFHTIPGGKGANQAVAASRAGASTRMIGCVGADAFGEVLLQSLRAAGVDVNGVQRIQNISTGTATIVVEESGENRIIIIPGANGSLLSDRVVASWDLLTGSAMVLLQHEIPLPTIHEVIQRCHRQGIRVLLNPAPMYPIPAESLALVDTLVLNETEAAALTRQSLSGIGSAELLARSILQAGVKTVIITFGELGAVLLDKDGWIYQPAFKVDAVDTTAAGDTFVGSYAASILAGRQSAEALRFACAASAIAVTRLGAQASIPHKDEVEEFLASTAHQQAMSNKLLENMGKP